MLKPQFWSEFWETDLYLKIPLVLLLLLQVLKTFNPSDSFEAYLKTWIGPSGLSRYSFKGSIVVKTADETCFRRLSISELGFLSLNLLPIIFTGSGSITDFITSAWGHLVIALNTFKTLEGGILAVLSMLWKEKLAPLLFELSFWKLSYLGKSKPYLFSSMNFSSIFESEEFVFSMISTLNVKGSC